MIDSFLDQNPVIRSIPARDRAARCQDFHLYISSAGVPLFQEGDTKADEVYLVRSGLVKLVKYSPRIEPVIVEIVGRNDLFGFAAALGRLPYGVSAIPIGDGEIYRIPANSLRRLARDYAEFDLALWTQVKRRLNHYYTIQSLAREKVESRIAYWLCVLHDLAPQAIRVGHQDIALMAASSPWTAGRILAKFEKKKLISSGWKRITVLDVAGLKSICGRDGRHA